MVLTPGTYVPAARIDLTTVNLGFWSATRVGPTARVSAGRYRSAELETVQSSPPGRSTRAAAPTRRSAAVVTTAAPTWNGGLHTTRSTLASGSPAAASSLTTSMRSASPFSAAVARAEATA